MKSGVVFISLSLALSLGLACSENSVFKGDTKKGADEGKTNIAAEPEPETEDTDDADSEKKTDDEDDEKETVGLFKDCTSKNVHAFSADLYELPVDTKKLPEFSTMKSLKKICLKQVDITVRKFDEGFPEVENLKEWFALDFNFTLKVGKEGEYAFELNSDDGSKLIIDGKTVIDSDGQHAPLIKAGKIKLTAGDHEVHMPYFQGPADQIALELKWTPPGGSKEYIPVEFVTKK